MYRSVLDLKKSPKKKRGIQIDYGGRVETMSDGKVEVIGDDGDQKS
ncbi:hypothetical protein CathTA2_0831 [Caldalkalibacillus thermarum TA2.A1]|uniref:Uncharacterized protein n=1 Tax=Caldalkalibacillus thermarum (strain TA2.A1) TaxID=986075 RepID=F5L4W8_CALTT|nr:hypothetical protein CathTA2_0831 [Caldalkalibacillus thermarum TA2.A1]